MNNFFIDVIENLDVEHWRIYKRNEFPRLNRKHSKDLFSTSCYIKTTTISTFGQRSLWLVYEKIPLSSFFFLYRESQKIVNIKKYKKIYKKMAHVNSKHGKKLKKLKKRNNQKYKNKKKCVKWGPIFTICSVWSLTHLPQLEQSSLHPQQFSVIVSCYRPPATTISVFSYTSTALVKKQKQQQARNNPP